jgi:hypothetical protein
MFKAVHSDLLVAARVEVFLCRSDASACVEWLVGVCDFEGCDEIAEGLDEGVTVFGGDGGFGLPVFGGWGLGDWLCFVHINNGLASILYCYFGIGVGSDCYC